MRILIATDARSPQVNGVVRTLQSLAANARRLGAEIEFLTPEGFRSFPLPTYRSVRCAIPTWREIARRIECASADALHIATEGPIGHVVRWYCLARKIPFTTSYMTRFPEYVSARLPVPLSWSYAVLRRFHAAAAVTMVSTQSLIEELSDRGFAHLAQRSLSARARRRSSCSAAFPMPIFSVSWKGKPWRRISPRRMCSCFRAGPTHSASCSSRRSLAACRSPPTRSPDHRT
jgi:hypothetical protein